MGDLKLWTIDGYKFCRLAYYLWQSRSTDRKVIVRIVQTVLEYFTAVVPWGIGVTFRMNSLRHKSRAQAYLFFKHKVYGNSKSATGGT